MLAGPAADAIQAAFCAPAPGLPVLRTASSRHHATARSSPPANCQAQNRMIWVPSPSRRTVVEAANIRQGANSAPFRPTEAITLRNSRYGSEVWPTAHSLTASCTHTASDVFVIPKAGRSAQGSLLTPAHSRALFTMMVPITVGRVQPS
jgi:hypothetical protein